MFYSFAVCWLVSGVVGWWFPYVLRMVAILGGRDLELIKTARFENPSYLGGAPPLYADSFPPSSWPFFLLPVFPRPTKLSGAYYMSLRCSAPPRFARAWASPPTLNKRQIFKPFFIVFFFLFFSFWIRNKMLFI